MSDPVIPIEAVDPEADFDPTNIVAASIAASTPKRHRAPVSEPIAWLSERLADALQGLADAQQRAKEQETYFAGVYRDLRERIEAGHTALDAMREDRDRWRAIAEGRESGEEPDAP